MVRSGHTSTRLMFKTMWHVYIGTCVKYFNEIMGLRPYQTFELLEI